MLDDREPEGMLLAGSAGQENAAPEVERLGLFGAEPGDQSLKAAHAQCHVDERAQVLLPEPPEKTGGGCQQAEEEALGRVPLRDHPLEVVDERNEVRSDGELHELGDLLIRQRRRR